jgi:hypothetical protein
MRLCREAAGQPRLVRASPAPPEMHGLALAHRQRQLAGPHASGTEYKKEALKEDCRPYRDDRQSRPVKGLLRQPVQLVLRAVGRITNAHLRDCHLRH